MKKLKNDIDYLKNFGFADETTVVASGINGKMNEIQAAFGLLQLQHIDSAFFLREKIYARYVSKLAGVSGIGIITIPENTEWNYSYCPVFVDNEFFPESRDSLYDKLKSNGVYARRYFYPLISEFPMYKGYASASKDNLKHAMRLSRQVLCLPIYPDLSEIDQDLIIELILALSQVKAA
jgi:Predicted pyridoxal phosphate-dependent enzyme apparently involved in regulation of cell wall biogenesis